MADRVGMSHLDVVCEEVTAALKPLNTLNEVATVARCSKRTTERALERGELVAVRRGSSGKPLIPRASVLQWLGLGAAS